MGELLRLIRIGNEVCQYYSPQSFSRGDLVIERLICQIKNNKLWEILENLKSIGRHLN